MRIYKHTGQQTEDMNEIIATLRGVVGNTNSETFTVYLMDGAKAELTGCEFHRLLDYAYAWLRSQ